jgi:hypothetical protein
MSASLYVLADPRRPKAIRYVGWTSGDVKKRLQKHITNARTDEINHRCCWIRSLLAVRRRPVLRVVATCPTEEGPAIEVDIIAALRAMGHRLVNGTDGGDGAVGRVVTGETRAKIGRNTRERMANPEARAQIATSLMGHLVSEETRKRIAAKGRGRKQKPATIAKRVAKNTGQKRSPEICAKFSVSQRDVQHGSHSMETREKMSESHRIWWARHKQNKTKGVVT